MNKRSDSHLKHVRTGIIVFIAVLIAVVLGYGTLYSTGVTQGDFVEGEHYELIEEPERQRADAPISVTEFFSYGCVHCKSFDPLIDDWRSEQGPDVAFRRDPVAFSAQSGLLAATYRALEQTDALEHNHERIFRAIHDNGRVFDTPDAIGDYVDGYGITKNDFLHTLNSPDVRQALREDDRRQRTFKIDSTPSIVVAGKYLVSMDHGRKMALDIVDHLIGLERSARANTGG
ncbi:MAG: thiol:disulfide interchange protein DsbA/DsbL [Pseudomonadales bacterium]|jgi:thiol:disulfide interchange protein DsbA|nr:thiol:disulfide interchange protein DsbA/DsbL [Pseudomonadales bacterium]MDP6471094.1 thiol:disulfide interchange protein DsbA/DsbL [Pseudomonadales bacterium]MDP6825720.1 thiol:disulfide interchange protein DsbA/DsbL [Pseudomonadales bacterium]MDP6973176.1 thiol:disulfide interchange protein DsbA/DsbL [Pseudomonadales bacterium]|tara:strand:- start:4254 stop:4946 length:693 start_codon:yes stop_codon:yes gene_type:complete